VLRIATRGSELALVQARLVASLLAELPTPVATEILVVETLGDRRQDVPIHSVGGQGIFVKEVEAAVLEGRADLAVHSAKDLPATAGGGAGAGEALAILAVPERGDPRDAIVGAALDDLAPGARVATGSVRRRAQLAWLRPDLVFVELRGNMATRLAKVPIGGALVAAQAALVRLGRAAEAAEVLSTVRMLPQVGQGAIAVCGRPDDDEARTLLAPIVHQDSASALEAERGYLRAVGGGCDLPVGAFAEVAADGSLRLEAMIASLDGHVLIRRSIAVSAPTGSASGPAPAGDGAALGAELAAAILDESGGRELLERMGARP
jgi:hydroxymethylbilane synthase